MDRISLDPAVLRQLMDFSGLGPTRLADVLGKSQGYGSQLKKGERMLSCVVQDFSGDDPLHRAAPYLAPREDITRPADDFRWVLVGDELEGGLTVLPGFGRSARVGVYSPDPQGLAMAAAASAPLTFVRASVHVAPVSLAYLQAKRATVEVTLENWRDHVCGAWGRLGLERDPGIPLLNATTTTDPSPSKSEARAGPVAGGVT